MIEYSLMSLIISVSDVLGFCKNSSMSSAYNEILWLVLIDRTPIILSFCLIAAARGYINKAKSSGDKGHPWRVPRWSWNGDDIMPLVMTDASGVLYSVLIQWIKQSPNPHFLSVM